MVIRSEGLGGELKSFVSAGPPPDFAAVAALNGFSDAASLSKHDSIVLPDPWGGTMSFDIGGSYRDRDALISEYWQFHPRFLFLKSIRNGARLADLGAGSGGLIGWKSWGSPDRRDLKMYAADLSKGEFFDRYEDFDLVDLGKDRTKFPDRVFDSVILSHVIEHVADRQHLSREVARITKPGAKIYIEWPRPESGRIISRSVLEPFGIACSTLNFFDDATHLELITPAEAEAAFAAAGFVRIASGDVINDFLFPELFRCGLAQRDSEATTYALWLAFRFSCYLIMEKA